MVDDGGFEQKEFSSGPKIRTKDLEGGMVGENTRLGRLLGEGSMNVVYLAHLDGADPEKRREWVVKVAIAGRYGNKCVPGDFTTNRETKRAAEQMLLEAKALELLAKHDGDTHYFPRLRKPWETLRTIEDLVTQVGVKGNLEKLKVAVLETEYVPHETIDDLGYPGDFPEPLWLDLFSRYLDSVRRSSLAGVFTSDRKPDAIGWQEEYPLNYDNPGNLERLREGEDPGRLKVLDWNVVYFSDKPTQESADKEALEFFAVSNYNFSLGVFAYYILGKRPNEPRQDDSGLWLIDDTLVEFKGYSGLSYQARRIVKKLFKPTEEVHYRSVQELMGDFQEALDLWKTNPSELWEQAEKVAGDAESLSQEDLEKGFAAADTLRVLVEKWGEERPDGFDETYLKLAKKLGEETVQKKLVGPAQIGEKPAKSGLTRVEISDASKAEVVVPIEKLEDEFLNDLLNYSLATDGENHAEQLKKLRESVPERLNFARFDLSTIAFLAGMLPAKVSSGDFEKARVILEGMISHWKGFMIELKCSLGKRERVLIGERMVGFIDQQAWLGPEDSKKLIGLVDPS